VHAHAQRMVSVVKIETVLEGYTTEEQRLLWAKKLHAKDIHIELFPVHGGKCSSCEEVPSWWQRFR
jgi:hypothetical protein